ncbi:unnamed protein product [Larinioides sclopetarius]|uniref:Uncharacterized protein n=1 Tax=Larinioides sclopetarius TaxID=280406 RepID=A0AAV1YV03_9ARAC
MILLITREIMNVSKLGKMTSFSSRDSSSNQHKTTKLHSEAAAKTSKLHSKQRGRAGGEQLNLI